MASMERMRRSLGWAAVLAVFLLAGLTNSQDNDELINDQILAERVKRDVAGDGDVTTVLLVDNQKLNRDINSRNGRYLNVKPVIGLLTSTARTFIQDGVTTEYATEVVGTTLDNGRVYAQLLTKSSLVLYDKPSDYVQDTVKRTRLPFEVEAKKWSIDDNVESLRDQYIIKNTDYISPKDGAFTVFASKPSREYQTHVWRPTPPAIVDNEEVNTEAETETSKVQTAKEIPKYSEFEAFNFLDPLPAARERKISSYSNANVDLSKDDKSKIEKDIITDLTNKSKIVEPAKVKPNINLPTFTVKNEFSPIFYYIDNVESKTEKSDSLPNYLKNAKKLFGHKDDYRPVKTFTYFGFADFTTTVGETVIIFSPSTASAFVKENDITPSAKSEVQQNIATRIKTFLSSDLGMVTKTMHGHQLNMETALPTLVMQPDPARSSKALSHQLASLKNVLFEKPIQDEEQTLLDEKEKFNRVIASLKSNLFIRPVTQFGLHKESIQPSEASYSTIQRTHATEKLQHQEETIRERKVPKIQATEPLGILRSTSVIESSTERRQEVEEITLDTLTTSGDEGTEGEEFASTTENYGETVENTEDTLSTPQMEDSQDDIDETSNRDEDSGAVTCTEGIIPVSTMTTAYKTLTFLTTYFLPLEGTETTTSVKSREVVETETGFQTNLVCKSGAIEPTPTVKLDIATTSVAEIEDITEAVLDVTEASRPVLTTEKELKEDVTEKITTIKTYEETTSERGTTVELPETTEDRDESRTTTDIPTTEHSVSTSESHVEVSVTTESGVTLENRNNIETTTENEKINTTPSNDENEVDLIFKTLYTTYTYFTTFFQGDTSTVSSKKSVVTNVITSTLDISEIDPSIFNAIESSDYLFKATQKEVLGQIMPTSVGAGRPTQTFALNSILDLVRNRQVIDSAENDAVLNSRIPTPELADDSLIDEIKPDIVKTFYTTYTFFTTLYVGEDINICSRSEIYTNFVGPASLIPSKTSSSVTLNTKQNEIDFNKCKRIPAVKKASTPKEVPEKVKVTTESAVTNKSKQQVYTSIDRSNKRESLKADESKETVSKNTFKDIVLEKGDSMFVTDVKSSYSKGDRQIIDNAILDDQISSESNIDEIVPSSTLLLQTSYTTFTYFTTMYLGKDSSKVKSRLETVTNVVTETLDSKSVEAEETNLPITYYTTFTYWTTLYKDKTTTITSREDIISNVVTQGISPSTVNPIDTHPIQVATVKAPEINNQDLEIKPSTTVDDLLTDDGKATFYTTYTYFTTYYAGNTSELRSRLETETNIVDNTKDLVNENQLGRAVGKDSPANNLLDDGGKPIIKSTGLLDNVIIPTKVVGDNAIVQTQIVGSHIDDDKPDKKILSSQVAVISGDSTIIRSNENDAKKNVTATVVPSLRVDSKLSSVSPSVIESSVTEPTTPPNEEDGEEEDEDGNKRKKSRLTFTTKKRTFTPAIIPLFSSRSRPSFSPRRGALTSGVTTITRSDFTPTITATPALKSTKATGFGGRNRGSSSVYSGNSSSGGRRFSRISTSATPNSASPRSTGFGRGRSTSSDIQPSSSRRGGFRTSSIRASITDFSSRGPSSRIRPTLSSRFRGGARQTTTPSNSDDASTFVTDNPTALTNEAETVTQSNEGDSIRSTNSLLRFRRPPFTRAPTTPRTTTQASSSNRNRANNNRRGGTTTTAKPIPKTTTLNPLFALRNRQRPNSLFPPRGLINKQPEPKPEEETNAAQDVENEEALQEGEEEYGDDTDYESSNQESQVSVTSPPPAPARISNLPNIRPFGFRKRSKRQADYGYRKNFSNFRRPTARTSKPEPKIDVVEEIEEVTQNTRLKPQSRYNARTSNYQNTQKPTRGPRATAVPTTANRQQFILRGETTTHKPTFRSRTSRPALRSSAKPTINSRPSAPRLKTYTTPQAETVRSRTTSRSRGRGRTTSRYRTTSNDIDSNNYIYQSDGKLTITHKIPMEVTIPVVNGKITEYKNVITAKPSLETLSPNQYSTTQNAFGSQYIVLVSESSEPAENGATKVIQFILHETPTTSVIFTPTTIRGRKTSFSHVIPSTVYDVERVTSTIQPQISPNVPLANILLSQLLLGNQFGMPQPQINPLLALQGGQQFIPGTPTTEYKTRTTTYVTTVTDAKSTVLPITFRGKEILTTIVDSKLDVITATEFITDTIVVTPTVQAPQQNPNQLNSILLLLQQQQLQQPIQQQTANPLLGLSPDLNLLQKSLPLSANELVNSPKPEVLVLNEPEELIPDYIDEVTKPPPKKKEEKRKHIINKPVPPRESSIITLYVSGRHPGEFSTVLSTVYLDETQSVQKREAVYLEEYDLSPSVLPSLNNILSASQSDLLLDTFVMPAMDNSITQDVTTQYETQSLESILGEISKYMNGDNPTTIIETKNSEPTVTYIIKESKIESER